MKKLLLLLLLLTFSLGYSQPSTPAPVPTRLQADVLSVYSGTYAAAFGTVNWTNTADVLLAGNATKLATNVTYAQGAYASTSISGMTHIHIDIYSTTASTSQMKVQVGGTVKGNYATPNGVWTSLDLPLSTWSSPTTNNLINLQGYAGAGTFYFDNVYFYKLPAIPVLTTTAATAVGTTAGAMNGNISSSGDSNITSYGFYWSTTSGFADGAGTQVVVGTTNTTGAITSNLTGLSSGTAYYYKAYATNTQGTAYGTQQTFTTILPLLTGNIYINDGTFAAGDFCTAVGQDIAANDGTAAKPFATLAYALTRSSQAAGVVFYVDAGTYSWPATHTFTASGTLANPITIQGKGNAATIITSTASANSGLYFSTGNYWTVKDLQWNATTAWSARVDTAIGITLQNCIFNFTGTGTTIQSVVMANAGGQLTIKNSTLTRNNIAFHMIEIVAGASLTLQDNTIRFSAFNINGTSSSVQITPNAASVLIMERNKLYGGGYGVGFTNAVTSSNVANSNTIIKNNFFNTNWGIVNQMITGLKVYNNSFYTANNCLYGVTPAFMNNWDIQNNILYTYGAAACVLVNATTAATMNYNHYYYPNAGAGAGAVKLINTTSTLATWKASGNPLAIREANGQGGSVTANNPLYTNITSLATTDLHLQPASPAIGVGSNVGVTDDIDGNARPLGGAFDIGAIEYAFPTIAAPTPTSPSGNVISIFSNAYSPTASVDLNAFQNAAGSTIQIVSNDTRYYPNFLYAGNSFTPVNLTSYVSANLNIWSSNISYMKFYLVGVAGGEAGIQFAVTPNAWNSITIPLSSYSSEIRNSVQQLKYTNVNSAGAEIGGGILYFDNVYFDKSTTWKGTTSTNWVTTSNWSTGAAPIATSDVVIATGTTHQPIIGSTVSISSLTIQSGATLTVNTGNNLTVANAVANSGTMTLQNNANLIQTAALNTNSGSGTAIVNRNSASIQLYDYTLWSSPVAGQKLKAFSPNTLDTRFYTYNSGTNLYNVVTTPATTDFAPATGYLIRAANTLAPATPTTFNGVFTGVPNNGDIPFTMVDGGVAKRFNLVGNPYPSPITISTFVSNNSENITGTLYFWRKTNGSGSAYCTYSGSTFVTNGNALSANPNGVIQTGQGFFVEGTGAGTALTFKNTQRVANIANQFFRTNDVENNRIWLNLTNATGVFSQMAVGYITDATQGVDSLDGKYINDAPIALTSIINAEEYTIQGRALPFATTDTVPLGFKTNAAGNYTIAVDHVDGLFSAGQTVFLKDNLLNTVVDLSAGSYSFASATGTSNSRFEVVYQNTLAVTNPIFTANSVIAFSANGEIRINSGSTIMELVRVYDLQGRLLVEKKQINASETKLSTTATNQVLLVEITAANGSKITKKIIQ